MELSGMAEAENLIMNKKDLSFSRNELINKYQYLITKIVNQFKNIPVSRENLEEVGYIGLLNAVHLYNEKTHNGISFKAYAQIIITEEVHQYLLNHSRQVDFPDWLVSLNEQVSEFIIKYRENFMRFPELSEIASHFNVTKIGLQELLKARDSLKEVQFPLCQQSGYDLISMVPDLSKIKSLHYQSFKLPIEDLIVLKRAIKKINEIKEGIIHYLFVMDLSKTKLAQILGVSSEEINHCNTK